MGSPPQGFQPHAFGLTFFVERGHKYEQHFISRVLPGAAEMSWKLGFTAGFNSRL